MGTGNMKYFAGLEGSRVVAVCDTYEDRRQRAKTYVDNQYGDQGFAAYRDYRELLDRKDIDAVMIAPQDHWHALIATAAAKAGKDMYCEKPMGVSVEEGQKILAAVREHKRVFQAGTWQRSQQKFRHACELARNGYVGKIHTVQVAAPGPQYQPKYTGSLDPQPVPPGFDWERWCGPAPETLQSRPRGLARLVSDLGLLRRLHLQLGRAPPGHRPLGLPAVGDRAVRGGMPGQLPPERLHRQRRGLERDVHVRRRPEDDLHGRDPPETGTRFIGDQGWVHVDRAGIWAEPESLLKVKLKEGELQLHASKHHQDDFLSSVRSRQDPVSNADATHVASYLGLIADIAARRGRS